MQSEPFIRIFEQAAQKSLRLQKALLAESFNDNSGRFLILSGERFFVVKAFDYSIPMDKQIESLRLLYPDTSLPMDEIRNAKTDLIFRRPWLASWGFRENEVFGCILPRPEAEIKHLAVYPINPADTLPVHLRSSALPGS